MSKQDRPDRFSIQKTTPCRGIALVRNSLQKPFSDPAVSSQSGINGTRLKEGANNLPGVDLEKSALCQPEQNVISQISFIEGGDQDLDCPLFDRQTEGHPHRQRRIALVDHVHVRSVAPLCLPSPSPRRMNPNRKSMGQLLVNRCDLGLDL